MASDPTEATGSHYPHGVPCWMELLQSDTAPARDFYAGLFGWRFTESTTNAASSGDYHVASLPDGDVAAIGALTGPAPGWTMYVRTDDLDETGVQVIAAGGVAVDGPQEAFDGGRQARFQDPAGAVFGLWQPLRHPGAQVVNAPNSWNFNELHTADADAAADFYGAVFGWETTPLGPDLRMVRRPGYSDVLEQFDPGLRERHAEAGIPPGFSDAVAWIDASSAAATPSFWNVTFSVADTDQVAARAESLGGSVSVHPFSVEGSRVAVLADPQGARFTVSCYQPSG